MPKVTVDGLELAVLDPGGDGAVVLLAHGFGLDKTMFADLATALAPRYRVITWDSAGHGDTTSDGSPYTYWDLARGQLQLMDALGVERAVVGGVSQGGFIALRTALLAPERVTSLVLMDTEASALAADDRAQYTQLFAALTASGPIDDLIVPLSRQIVGDERLAAVWAARWRERGVPLGAPVDCLITRDDIVDRLAEITCPALLLRGSEDVSIPVERMALLRDHLPGSTDIQTVDGAGHSPALTHPAATAAIISAFLAGELPAKSQRMV
ncbi:alpha/beta hydrolase [Actinokineospora auranticolor]|uniref:Pimeloyl-ACP methyl ester carboxylesterase n=1 Tax=Actinokineospora auranticolor TaxID=155976 RepID=A0A2S6GJ00_9PSEU|nr:alpha/beta hydrolase [Actinokineospora auranticolor]PPK65187.1 pimeloyl-ACP methyl ester carboxylesterase [Actinokineospora auranticolor]